MEEFCNIQFEKLGYQFRLAKAEEAEAYFEQNYQPLDPLVVKLTGCKAEFSREEVITFFLKSLESNDRYWFFIISPDGRIVGESVICDIDWQAKNAHFRLCLFQPNDRGKGIGRWAVETTCHIVFTQLKLHRLSLEVFSFNPIAEKIYQKVGFSREGVLKDAVLNERQYADIILMAMLEDDWEH